MNQSASKPEGLSTIMGLMPKMGTSNPVDDISKSLTSSSTSGGSGTMSSIQGSHAPTILQSATKSTGSSSSVVSKIMSMVLLLLLGALTKKFTASTGADGLKKLLGEESEKALSPSTGAASILNAATSKESAGIFGSVKKLFGMQTSVLLFSFFYRAFFCVPVFTITTAYSGVAQLQQTDRADKNEITTLRLITSGSG